MKIGYSQRRAALTIYAWCGTLTGAALATRLPSPSAKGASWHLWETIAVAGIALHAALAFSLYVVYVLEILKSSNPRRFRLGRRHDELDERRSA